MSPAALSQPLAVSLSGRTACAVALSALCLLAGSARAELLGTHPHRDGTVRLMTELCRANDASAGQHARQTVGGRERRGCWGVDRAGNPVVTWRDGSELLLDGQRVKLSRRMGELLERAEASRRAPEKAATPTARAHAQAKAQAPRDFPRPAWCPNARFPHERLVCTDAQLAARDLQLASLWLPYRRTLSRGAEAWHKSDYFRRLKACGAERACIVGEQATQMRRYRAGLPAAS